MISTAYDIVYCQKLLFPQMFIMCLKRLKVAHLVLKQSKVAPDTKSCSRLLEREKVAQNSKSCSQVAEHNL